MRQIISKKEDSLKQSSTKKKGNKYGYRFKKKYAFLIACFYSNNKDFSSSLKYNNMIGNAFFTILQLCKIKQHQRLKRIQYCNRETLRVSNTRLPPFYYKSVRIIHLKSSTFLKRLYNLYTDQFPHCFLPVSTAFSESFSDLLYASSSSLDILTPIRTMSPPVAWRP